MTSFGHIIRTGSALLFAIVGGLVGVYFYKTRQPPFKEQLGNSSEVNQTIVEDADCADREPLRVCFECK